MPLPCVQQEIVAPMLRDITGLLFKGGDYNAETEKVLKEENLVLWQFLGFMSRRNGEEEEEEEEGKAFMDGALLTYRLLRQQAEVDALENG